MYGNAFTAHQMRNASRTDIHARDICIQHSVEEKICSIYYYVREIGDDPFFTD